MEIEKLKGYAETLLETIRGINNEGSSKRATAFGLFWVNWFLAACYGFAYVYSATRAKAEVTTIHETIINQFPYVVFLFLTAMLTCLGLTTWEKKNDNKNQIPKHDSNNKADNTNPT
jgi:hypothetical protein